MDQFRKPIAMSPLKRFAPFMLTAFALVALIASNPSARAQGGGGGGFGTAEFDLGIGTTGIGASQTQIDVSPRFWFSPISKAMWFQLGGGVTYEKLSYRGGDTHSLLFIAGVTLNVGPRMADASFISIGFASRSGGSSAFDDTTLDPDGTGFYFLAGKRIDLSAQFALKPSIGVVGCGTTAMIIEPFAVSYLF